VIETLLGPTYFLYRIRSEKFREYHRRAIVLPRDSDEPISMPFSIRTSQHNQHHSVNPRPAIDTYEIRSNDLNKTGDIICHTRVLPGSRLMMAFNLASLDVVQMVGMHAAYRLAFLHLPVHLRQGSRSTQRRLCLKAVIEKPD
jgi:hypothetical protein